MTRATDPQAWFVYIVRCADNSLYTGISPDVDARLEKHRRGAGARYLRGRSPLQLVASLAVGDRSRATRAELAFKRLSKARKESLLVNDDALRGFFDSAI